jgi:hypothetical protein
VDENDILCLSDQILTAILIVGLELVANLSSGPVLHAVASCCKAEYLRRKIIDELW